MHLFIYYWGDWILLIKYSWTWICFSWIFEKQNKIGPYCLPIHRYSVHGNFAAIPQLLKTHNSSLCPDFGSRTKPHSGQNPPSAKTPLWLKPPFSKNPLRPKKPPAQTPLLPKPLFDKNLPPTKNHFRQKLPSRWTC